MILFRQKDHNQLNAGGASIGHFFIVKWVPLFNMQFVDIGVLINKYKFSYVR